MSIIKRRVVITGIGIISPLGNKLELWHSLLNGQSGIKNITSFDVTAFPVKIAAEVTGFNPDDYLDRKTARRMDLFCQYAVAAASLSLSDANLTITKKNADAIGVLIGSGMGGIQTLEKQSHVLYEHGPERISPFFVPMLIPDMASGQVAIATGAKGPNSCTVTACASGANAIGDAYRMITHGDAEVMLTGGCEAAIAPLALAGFAAARSLVLDHKEPHKASRPFDRKRNGFVMGEGAAVLVLEELEHALARDAKIYAELIGFGSSGDAHHITAPAPEHEGAQRAMRAAMNDANISAHEVDYINAHGTSTQLNDKYETQAIKQVFGERAYEIAVSSTKALTGHLLGAAGALEAAIVALSLEAQVIPGTYNYEEADPDCDLDYVPNTSRFSPLRIAMSNSFGFGGHNAVLVLRRMEE